MRRRVKGMFSLGLICSLVFIMPWTVYGTTPGYFENPEKSYQIFEKQIYDKTQKEEYAFLKVSVPVYNDWSGSREIEKAPKYSGLIVLSKTASYVQVIYEKKEGNGIGWITKKDYREHTALYDGSEKQLLANGMYCLENKKDPESTMEVNVKFLGNQQYAIKELEAKTGNKKRKWQLIREYDHFYLKETKSKTYLKMEDDQLEFEKKKKHPVNRFDESGQDALSEKFQWKLLRMANKNVKPYRNFLQYDPAWARKNYGDVKEYSGKIAAAGCGVVAITNAVYALNGYFVDPMLFADLAVEENYRIIGFGTDDGIFEAAAKRYGDAYGFYYAGSTDSLLKVRQELQDGCVVISHVPGHYVTVADYNQKTKKYLVLDSHPIAARPTSPFGDWFSWDRLVSGGLSSSQYYIFSPYKDKMFSKKIASLFFQRDCMHFIFWMTKGK